MSYVLVDMRQKSKKIYLQKLFYFIGIRRFSIIFTHFNT